MTDELLDRIAHLEAKAEALQEALLRRSDELRRIQEHVCPSDLVVVSRVCAGLPLAKGAYDPAFWRETIDVTEAEIESTLEDLWLAVTPATRGR